MTSIVGIDLGTTNSVLTIMEGGKPVVIPNAEGQRVTPSVVAFTDKDGILVGESARRQSLLNPRGTIWSIKRFMGKRFDEVSEEDKRHVPYETCDQLNGDIGVRVQERVHSPSEISAHILASLRATAERYLSRPVDEAIITVPAYFNDAQRRATQVAGEIAGFKVRRIINEPTAAALAFGLNRTKDERIAVYDFGGGTFDISILEIGDGVIEVLSTHGDAHLGGDDIDQCIVDAVIGEFEREHRMSIRHDAMILQRVREAAEKAKKELSTLVQTDIHLPFLTADSTGPKHLSTSLTRAQLEAMIHPLIERSLASCRQALEDAGLKAADLQEILLVGGSTRIPLVQQAVERFFGRAPNHSLNPDEVVALGAAIQGGILAGEVDSIILLDVTPLTLGIEANGGLMIPLIERNTTIPARKNKLFSTTVDNQSSVAINVYQGERDFAAQNRFLGQFELTDIEPAPRATPKIDVCFDIDANGVLRVSATNQTTGKEETLVLTGAGGLSDDEIRSAIVDAEAARAEDSLRKERLVAKNKAQSFVFSIAKLQREYFTSADDALNAHTTELLQRCEAILSSDEASTEDFTALSAELSACSRQWHELLHEHMAQQESQQNTSESCASHETTDGQN
ncbi:MAG: molecular chaperone DnaK [Proteobacteria bacterium]|nr:molecular chaperone DnaK [Pseudomonadota bacterium]